MQIDTTNLSIFFFKLILKLFIFMKIGFYIQLSAIKIFHIDPFKQTNKMRTASPQ